jgi:hypothetical protein
MYIPLSVILHFLGNSFWDISGSVNPEALIYGARIIMPDESATDPGIMYITSFTEMVYHKNIADNMVFLCLQDNGTENISIPEKGTVLLYTDQSTLSNLLLKIQSIFLSLEHWHCMMIQGISEKDLQKLLDSGFSVIGNSLTVCDSNHALIACAINPENDDPVLCELVQNRAFSKSIIESYNNADMPFKIRQQQGIQLKAVSAYSKYRSADYTVMVDNEYYLRIKMFFDRKEVDRGLLDLFSMLIGHIKMFVKLVPDISGTYRDKCVTFLLDLIEGRLTDPAVISMRAQFCGMNPKSQFSVYKVIFNSNKPQNLVVFVAEKLRATWPAAKVVPLKNEIVLVTGCTDKELQESGAYALLAQLMKSNEAMCGFSSSVKGIANLKVAYMQAGLAIQFGMQVSSSNINFGMACQGEYGDAALYSYEKYYIFGIYNKDFLENMALYGNTQSMQILFKLWISDKTDHMNNLALLHEYLISGLRATETAKSMHMHRNSVLYRIEKIEDAYGIDLGCSETCIKLILAYRLLDYYGDLVFHSMIDTAASCPERVENSSLEGTEMTSKKANLAAI